MPKFFYEGVHRRVYFIDGSIREIVQMGPTPYISLGP